MTPFTLLFSKIIFLHVLDPPQVVFFHYDSHKRIRPIIQLRVGLSHLREHKFRHNFQKFLNPICSCDLDIQSNSHFFLHCHIFHDGRRTLLSNLNRLKIRELTNSSLSQTLLYGSTLFDKKTPILNATIENNLSTGRSAEPLI